MAWPSSRAMRSPTPSLPVAGTESPPVARMTRAARIVSPDESCTAQQSSERRRSVTRVAVHTRPPRWTYAVISASSTVRARSLAGKSLPVSASSLSGTPSSTSKKRRTSASGQAASTFRRRLGELSLTKSVCDAWLGSTLQRPPPLIRIFWPGRSLPSSSSTGRVPAAAWIAAIRPAAPAPTTHDRQSIDFVHLLISHPGSRHRYHRVITAEAPAVKPATKFDRAALPHYDGGACALSSALPLYHSNSPYRK